MEMELMPDAMMSCDRDHRARQIVRGKRTKRPRPCSPVVSDCVSSEISTEEDEDMANCLIMLAQSVCFVKDQETSSKPDQIRQKTDKLSSKRLSEMTTNYVATSSSGIITKAAAAGFYVYECKTCNRTFPSFQALGGHRASHKKPKLNVEDKKSINSVNTEKHHHHDHDHDHDHDHQHKVVTDEDEDEDEGSMINNNLEKAEKSPSPSPSPDFVQAVVGGSSVNKLAKVHECSICGSEFTSGQALGGHMRKHRPILPSINRTMINQEMISSADDHNVTEKSSSGGGSGSGNMLSLDLNLPPPELVDDHVKFPFTANSSSQQRLIFSAPALVDCHY